MSNRDSEIDFDFGDTNTKRVYSTNASRAKEQHEKLMSTLERAHQNNNWFQPLAIFKGAVIAEIFIVLVPLIGLIVKWLLLPYFNISDRQGDLYIGAWCWISVLIGYWFLLKYLVEGKIKATIIWFATIIGLLMMFG
jgi:hypothetical protein